MTVLPELYVMRHGETVWNLKGRWHGSLDSALTAKGRSQAIEMGQKLLAEGVSALSHVALTSPQTRAIRTCDLALAPIAITPEVCDDLREIGIGVWTGLTRNDMRAGWPDLEVDGWMDVYANAPGGEGFEAVWERAGRVLERLDAPTIVVTHGITSRILRTRAMGLSFEDLDELPGGQGVIHHIRDGIHRTI
ncbi:MAG: histidine phosphatase family protein [Boseongicola sp.]|nr:histidine phosphatase family protein [Boseongicola sp.]